MLYFFLLKEELLDDLIKEGTLMARMEQARTQLVWDLLDYLEG